MYTLKIVRPADYEDHGMFVKEEEVYHEVGVKTEVLLYHPTTKEMPIAKVISDGDEILIYCDESAYLVNQQGSTVRIINRVTQQN
jgi:hypothetical protein